jgi:hypothetical protein
MKKIVAAVVCLLIVLGAGLYVFVVRPLVSPAAQTPRAEDALAKPDVILLAGANVKQAAFLERWLLGAPVSRAADEAPARPAPDRTLFEHLRAAKIDARRDVDYALYALYPADGANLRHAVVLVGRFDPRAVNAYLAQELRGAPRAAAGRDSYEIARLDAATCRPDTPWVVTADPTWILVADPASHPILLQRLTTPAGSGTERQLTWWRPLAHGDVLSLGVWGLKDVEKATAHPFLKGSAHAMTVEADGFQHAYLGLGARTVPPQGRLRIVLDADDASRAGEKVRGWAQALGQSRARWAETLPSLAALFDSLTLRADGARSTIEFTVDRALAGNLQKVANELVAAALGGFGIRQSPARDAGSSTERIDPNPLTFAPSLAGGALSPYDPAVMFAEDVDQIQGPFGLRLGTIRVGTQPDVGLELVVEGFGGPIPNLTGDAQRARLFVDGVTSSSGHALLRSEECGPERNDQPAPFSASQSRLKASKTIRLIPGADPHALQSIKGHIELRLPTRTEAVSLSHPAAGASLTKNGATFTVTKVEAGSVAYQITGARQNVLHFRALNGAGKPLSSESAFSSDFLLGDGMTGQTSYRGVVEGVEVIFATEDQPLQFPFTLTDFSLAGKPGAAALDTAPPFQTYSPQALRREPPRFDLSFDRAQAFFVTRLEFTLRSPALPNFEKAFTVGRLRLNRIQLKDGTALEPPPTEATASPAPSARWETAIRFDSPPKDGVLATPLALHIDNKMKPEAIDSLQGVLTVNFPKALQTLRLDDLTPGRQAALGDLSVTVVARSRKGLTLQTSKDGDRLLYVRLIDAGGQALAYFRPQITESPAGDWRFELSALGAPVRAELVLASQMDRKDYPVALRAK